MGTCAAQSVLGIRVEGVAIAVGGVVTVGEERVRRRDDRYVLVSLWVDGDLIAYRI